MAESERVVSLLWFEKQLTNEQRQQVEAALAGTTIKFVDGIKPPIVVEMRVVENTTK